MITCPNCQAVNPPGSTFCDNCGSTLQAPVMPPPVAPPVVNPPPQPQAIGGSINCGNCGSINEADSAFCENCGHQLNVNANIGVVGVSDPQVVPVPGGVVSGRFVVVENNANLPIPPGLPEVVLGREDAASSIFPEIDLDPYDAMSKGVGRQHAKLSAQGGQIFIEDLNTVNGTTVNKQKLGAGQKTPLVNGTEVILGAFKLIYYSQ